MSFCKFFSILEPSPFELDLGNIKKEFLKQTEVYCGCNSNFSKTKLLGYLEHLCNF